MEGKELNISVVVPATSANLGPGFDIFGIAFKVYNQFKFHFGINKEFSIHVQAKFNSAKISNNDLVKSSYQKYFEIFLKNQTPIPYSLKMYLEIPLGSGLGSSASAIIAGFCAAREVHKIHFRSLPVPGEREFIFEMAKLENHPDNITPAFLGGFVFSFFNEKKMLSYYKHKISNRVKCFVLTSENFTSTKESRKSLPSVYTTEDVVFNMSRVALWMEFLNSGNPSDLELALHDKIHTPYRLNLEEKLQTIISSLQGLMIGYVLSGSGPSLLFFIDRKKSILFQKKFQGMLQELDLKNKYQLNQFRVDYNGTQVRSH